MTAIIGINHQNSLFICADKRRTDLTTGSYTDDAKKIYELNSNILLSLAGNVAVTDVLIKNLEVKETTTVDEIIPYIRTQVKFWLSVARKKVLKRFKKESKKPWFRKIFYKPSVEEQEYLDNIINIAYILAGFDSSGNRVLYKFTSENHFQGQLQPINSPAIIGSGEDKVKEYFVNKTPKTYSLKICEQAIGYASKSCGEVSPKTYNKTK